MSGEDVWCQGYCEPNSGSDLASLGTRAVRDGDEWVINGQKIWTSGGPPRQLDLRAVPHRPRPCAKQAGHLVPAVPPRPARRRGASPRQRRRHHDFNEVFFTDARTAVDNVVGGVDNGWAVANTLLAFERGDDATVAGIRYGEELGAPDRRRPWQRAASTTR